MFENLIDLRESLMRVSSPKIKTVNPSAGVEGGRIEIEGTGFTPEEGGNTQISFGSVSARPLLISKSRIITQIPDEADSGLISISVKNKTSNSYEFVLGRKLTSAVNPVDNPIFDPEGNLYVTFSGKRGETVPVSVFKIPPDGELEPFLSNIANATSMAMDKDRNLYISSRFEGIVYKATPDADVTIFARDLGIPTGLALNDAGFLFVGDRNGRILKISPDGEVSVFAEIPESMVAFHLAFDNDGNLLVSSPALTSYNHIWMVDRYGKVIPLYPGFGRPQGIAVDVEGNIYVCEAKAGDSGIVRISPNGEMKVVVSGPVIVGVAFDNKENLAIATPSSVYLVPLSSNGK